MRASVHAAFAEFTTGFEGRTTWMYLDVKGYVTTGVGNLIDPVGIAIGLPWTLAGRTATREEIVAEFHAIKKHGDLAPHGGGAFRDVAVLRLSEADVDALVLERVTRNDGMMKNRFGAWEAFPADAQLAIHSLCWACGVGWTFEFPKASKAIDALDFATCAGPDGDPVADPTCRGQAWIRETGNPGLRRRNLANRTLFANAARVVAKDLDRDALYYPHVVDDVDSSMGEQFPSRS